MQRQRQSGFLPPGRPKKWREKAMEVLEKAVEQRIEGTQIEERADDKMWLVRYLEVCSCCCTFTCVGCETLHVNAFSPYQF
jgi:exocyst complex component 3